MRSNRSSFACLSHLLAGAVILTLLFANGAIAQRIGMINTGTTITVRTTEDIDAKDSDGRVFSGVVDQDVMNRNGTVAIPRGSNVELVVKEISDSDVAVDLDSLIVNGQRYSVDTTDSLINSERKQGLGTNKRTGKYVGGGALLGAVIGAITGGGKGAAIGAGVGAAAGAGTQILTRGNHVSVPAESLLTFRLQQPLRTGVADRGFTLYGTHYHPIYGSDVNTTSRAYRDGLQAGRADWSRNLPWNLRSSRWTSRQARRDYEAGYNRGYQSAVANNNARYSSASIYIRPDNNISWYAPAISRVYVQVDNNPIQLFGEGKAGTQAAPWIQSGHVYTFFLRDMRGNEIARDRLDTRRSPGSYRRPATN